MISSKGALRPRASPFKENSLVWKKHRGELFPLASGIQTPMVGQADSSSIMSKDASFDQPFLSDDLDLLLKHKKKTVQNTRLLGDVVDPFRHGSTNNLQKLVRQTCLYLPDVGKKRSKKQEQAKTKEISGSLRFAHDVVAFHCSHLLDYDEEKLNRTVYQRRASRRPRLSDKSSSGSSKLIASHQNNQRENESECQKESLSKIDEKMKRELDEILYSVAKSSRPFHIQNFAKPEQKAAENSSESSIEWDEYLLALLSRSTATWLSNELSAGTQQTRLTSFLKNRYDQGESLTQPEEETRKRENSKVGAELEKILNEANLAAHYSPSFTLPATVGNKKLTSDNIFQQEMMAGAFPVRGRQASSKNIVLDTNSHLKFEKKLQANFPEDPEKWSLGKRGSIKNPAKVVKGLKRWNELPALLEDDTYVPCFQTFEEPKETLREIELVSAHKTRENNTILRIGEEWRNTWLLEKRWQNASTEELIRGMNDINDHVRLAAVAACSKAAELRERKKTEESQKFISLRPETENTLDNGKKKSVLEPALLECISNLLEDNCKQVQITAAVTLCSLNMPELKAVEILQDSVQNGSSVERWLAAQCLALSGYYADYIITELLSQTSSADLLRQEQATVLLWKLSHMTSLVHTIVAELLNSSSCHARFVACRLLPRLEGSLNKDITHKLSYMMWNDWEKSVRTAAAQALGRTGNGKLVHDALLKKLLDNNERIKIDALRKLANLGIMTAHLLPSFLSCFGSEFVSVRLEAATASAAINTPNEGIMTALVKLARDDQSWKVKAHAINAIGSIGKVTDDVTEILVWSMRYSKVAAVRAEACKAVARLGLKDRCALSVLQDRLIVETEDIVRSEAERALKRLGVQVTGDLETLNTIRGEVKRLCRKENVIMSILKRDKKESYERDFERMIAAGVQPRCTETTQALRAVKSNDSLEQGWDPILAGFRACLALSEYSAPTVMKMERSWLPIDLNSSTSEGSQGTKSNSESISSPRSTTVDEIDAVK